MKTRLAACLIMALLSLAHMSAQTRTTLNPKDYGLDQARNGQERYYALLRCHEDAVKRGADVSYEGVGNIFLEIPEGAGSIPLTSYTDFAGTVMTVKNTGKNLTLFVLKSPIHEINVTKSMFGTGDFSSISELRSGRKVLVIQDKTPWVENRKGYSYGATRKDILVLENGKARNKTVMPYTNDISAPMVSWFEAAPEPRVFKNLDFRRTDDCTAITRVCLFENQYDVLIEGVSVTTNPGKLYGDSAISVVNSANISLNDIKINGTYSQIRDYGYGISLNNVYDITIRRMFARANWGVFGTNNVQLATLRDCDINRFDIHCYGRDVRSYNCKYSKVYNQFSSVYGAVEFYNCEFTEFRPVLMESSYNAYTPFDIRFEDCTFNMDPGHFFMLTLLGLEEAHNSRPELDRKCLSNIDILRCTVNLAEGMTKWNITNTGKVAYKETLDYIDHLRINGLTINSAAKPEFDFFTSPLNTTKTLKIRVKDMYWNKPDGSRVKYMMPTTSAGNNVNVKVNGKKVPVK